VNSALQTSFAAIVFRPRWGAANVWIGLVAVAGVGLSEPPGAASQEPAEPPPLTSLQKAALAAPSPESVPRLFIREYRVTGATRLPRLEVEKAVYPFLGPGRTTEDVEAAAAALEKAYRDQGFQTVAVQVPPQSGRRGIVVLKVVEQKVGRLRVKGSRYFSPESVKRHAPSMAEGTVPNFNDVQRDLIALNKWPDRRVSPELKPGALPDTVDIDLNVKDTLPLHGSLELNNRYSPDTTELRVNGSVSYANLWQAGHTAGFSFQVAPERIEDAEVYSGYYLAPVPAVEGLSLMVLGTKQNSDVSTLGGSAVAGRGNIVGARANIALPSSTSFFHNLSTGLDYKDFDEDVALADDVFSTPIDYYPFVVNYAATWLQPSSLTEFNLGVTMGLRGLGADRLEYDNKRFDARGSWMHLRGDAAHTRELPGGLQMYVKVQGQAATQPLINSEQYAGGGLGNARGYLESEALGDNAFFGTFEVRSPSLLAKRASATNAKASEATPADPAETDEDATGTPHEWRIHAFIDAGVLTLNDPLPEQEDRFELASIGVGTRFQLWNHFNGSLDAGFPLIDQGRTAEGDWRVTFRLWTEF
jgi:hemolysin activation/secretion protein